MNPLDTYNRSAANRADIYEDGVSVANSTASITVSDVSAATSTSIFSSLTSSYSKCTMVYFFAGLKMTLNQVTDLNAIINATMALA